MGLPHPSRRSDLMEINKRLKLVADLADLE
jgi:hypothetical protein